MSIPNNADLRKIILEVIVELGSNPTAGDVLRRTGERLNADPNPALQEAILTQWQELFTCGMLAWGTSLTDAVTDQRRFHTTDRGKETLKHLSRDPSNPDGYMNHLKAISLGPIAESYVQESLKTYNAACYKATAVMIGAAAEQLTIDLADAIRERLRTLGIRENKKLQNWCAKVVLDEISKVLVASFDNAIRADRDEATVRLRESFVHVWAAIAGMIRVTRNDAGHPGSINPVTPEDVHAALLTFPHYARILDQLKTWVATARL
jgi:hypothetical protein